MMELLEEKEQGSEFYDKAISLVELPLEESPWLILYTYALILLPFHLPFKPKIVDLGCGTGRFAKLLHTCRYEEYLGIDFSPVRIEMARKYVPDFKFEVGSFFDNRFHQVFSEFGHFVILEVLEHIRDDLRLLSLVPNGGHIIASVPNYFGEGTGHVRFFDKAEDLKHRYSSVMNIGSIKVIPIHIDHELRTKKFFLFHGFRK